MAKMLGQEVDPALVESIKREEYLNRKLLEKPVEIARPLPEAAPTAPIQEPAETNIVPQKSDLVQQVANVLASPAPKNPLADKLRDKELDGIRKTIAEMMQKISTMSWGSGGTGVVRIHDTDDFDKTSYGEGRYLKWSNGMFRLDEINPYEVVYNTTTVTSNNYTVADSDYYIGINYEGSTTINLPASPAAGRTVIIKDELGKAQFYPIHIAGTIDNDTNGATIKINNGAIQIIYNNGWRII